LKKIRNKSLKNCFYLEVVSINTARSIKRNFDDLVTHAALTANIPHHDASFCIKGLARK